MGSENEMVAVHRADDFNGDNAHLGRCIDALLDLDDAKALVPHGLGGSGSHAYRLLCAARARLAPAQPDAQQGEEIARLFHDTYERLAPSFGYETRADTKAFDPESANGKLMIAVCNHVAATLATPSSPALDAATIERCAAIADEHAEPSDQWSEFDDGYTTAAMRIAKAMRRALPNAEKRHG